MEQKNMKVGIKILPRKEILDTQGRAVEKVLRHHISDDSLTCRVGKFIEMEVKASNKDDAYKKIKEMADYVIYNPLIETYEIEFYE
jgi:phosphoribosylformylglycinamidine synthase PurS subunit